jgi:hypothetical protein
MLLAKMFLLTSGPETMEWSDHAMKSEIKVRINLPFFKFLCCHNVRKIAITF